MIAERLGLEPTRSYLRGTVVIAPGEWEELFHEEGVPIQVPFHLFNVEIGRRLPRTHYDPVGKVLESLLSDLLQSIEAVADRLDQLRDQLSASIWCNYLCHDKPVHIVLSDALLQRLAALRIPIRFFVAPIEANRPDEARPN
jgi:hypothetical protein